MDNQIWGLQYGEFRPTPLPVAKPGDLGKILCGLTPPSSQQTKGDVQKGGISV